MQHVSAYAMQVNQIQDAEVDEVGSGYVEQGI